MKQAQVILISQNLKLKSLKGISGFINCKEPIAIVSTHLLFDYERAFLESFMDNVSYYTFSDLLTDSKMEEIDNAAYDIKSESLGDYYSRLKALKNKQIVDTLEASFTITKRVIASDDLGIDEQIWINAGYQRFIGKYFYTARASAPADTHAKRSTYLKDVCQLIRVFLKRPVYSAHYGKTKYVFYGEPIKVAHRMKLTFRRNRLENYIYVANMISYKLFHTVPCRKHVIHLSTLHEHGAWSFFPVKNYKIQLLQDGYLPPNYTSRYLKFVFSNTSYLAYDRLGMQIFINQGIPVSLLPFRKKLYLPVPKFASKLKNILVVTSGAGDWTALKNRSDEDKMAEAFVALAAQYPEVQFIYRCHPLWIHPNHQGVNSINRIAEYFHKTGLTNLQISGNIPHEMPKNFHLFVPPQSLSEDLKTADLVIGEHSVAMLDAGFQGIPFASLNVTGRRDFFCGISDMGFPHMESIQEMKIFIDDFGSMEMQIQYRNAIKCYNSMIRKDY